MSAETRKPEPNDIQRRCWTLYVHHDGTGQCRLFNGHAGDHDFGTPVVDRWVGPDTPRLRQVGDASYQADPDGPYVMGFSPKVPTEDPELDVAWNEAVAALPKGWLGPNLDAYYPKGYEAGAHHAEETPGQGRGPWDTGAIYGETAAEALTALAEYLRRLRDERP